MDRDGLYEFLGIPHDDEDGHHWPGFWKDVLKKKLENNELNDPEQVRDLWEDCCFRQIEY